MWDVVPGVIDALESNLAQKMAGHTKIPARVVEEAADRVGVADGPASRAGTAGSGEEDIPEDLEGVAMSLAGEGR